MERNITLELRSPSGFTPLYSRHKRILHTHSPPSTSMAGFSAVALMSDVFPSFFFFFCTRIHLFFPTNYLLKYLLFFWQQLFLRRSSGWCCELTGFVHLLSWPKRCTCLMRVNVSDWPKINCCRKLKIDSQCSGVKRAVSKNFFPPLYSPPKTLCPHLNNIQVTADGASAASSHRPLTPGDARSLLWGSIANKYSLCDRALFLENLNLIAGQKTVSLRFKRCINSEGVAGGGGAMVVGFFFSIVL